MGEVLVDSQLIHHRYITYTYTVGTYVHTCSWLQLALGGESSMMDLKTAAIWEYRDILPSDLWFHYTAVRLQDCMSKSVQLYPSR